MSLALPEDRTAINWTTTLVMIGLHAGAVAALFHFAWKPFWLAIFLWWISGSLGIGLGYHRLLTHRGYRCPRWLEYGLAICGTLALEGGPIFWVGVHRIHHQVTDRPGDPHSPRDGKWWSHMGWVLMGRSLHQDSKELLPYVPDLRKDRFYLLLSQWHWVPAAVVGVLLFVFGGWKYLLWAGFLRTVAGLHFTWMVNSATHLWGSQRFATGDDSRNNFLVALLSFGEGWHNNHHAHPNSARHGLKWWEIDFNWYGIQILRRLGLATHIKLPRADSRVRPDAEPATVSPATNAAATEFPGGQAGQPLPVPSQAAAGSR